MTKMPGSENGLSVSTPTFIREHHVAARIRLHPVIGFLVGQDFGASIPKYLATAAMVPMIMTVEQIANRLVGYRLNCCYHALGVFGICRFNGNDTVGGNDKQ